MRTRRLIRVALSALVLPAVLLCFSASALAAPEAPVTREAKSIAGTTAVLHGVLNPRAKAAEVVEYSFAYAQSATECTAGLVAPVLPVLAPGNPGEAVSETLTGLEGSTTYTFCLLANPVGEPSLSGLALTFKTLAAAPEVDSASSSAVTPFEGTVEALVNPENQPSTSCVFEYGTSISYGKSVPCAQSVLEGAGDTGASATLTGLQGVSPTTTYHYRVVVKNATGEVKGPDGEFTTLEAVKPTVEPGSNPPSVTPFVGTVEGLVNPDYQSTSYSLEYSTTKPAGTKLEGTIVTVSGAGLLTGFGAQPVSISTNALTPATTYYYQVLASNETGTTEGAVESFKTLAKEAPKVINVHASSITPYAATIGAEVNPEYQTTSCDVEYGKVLSEHKAECAPPTLEGSGNQEVSLPVTGLEPGAVYHIRVIAENTAHEKNEGAGEFTAEALKAPVVESESASPQTPFAETLEAQVNPGYQETSCELEYGTEATLAHGVTTVQCNPAKLGNGGPGASASIALTGLNSATKYYFRVAVKNATGETKGTEVEPIKEFTTQTAEAPSVDNESIFRLSATGVTLEAQVNPNYQETTYTFEYAAEKESKLLEGEGTTVPGGSIPAGFGDQLARTVISRGTLSPGTTYFYRVVATNAAGTTAGMPTVQSFKTPVPPTASTGAAEDVTRTAATVSGAVNPEGQDTHYSVQYGPTPAYGYSTLYLDVGAGEGQVPTGPIALNTLSPGTTYHYRLVATNALDETTPGADMQFTTAPAPPPPAPPASGSNETPPNTTPATTSSASVFPSLTAITPVPATKEPGETTTSEVKSLTRTQKFSKALKACRKDAKGTRRASCERRARAKYGKAVKEKGR